MLKTSLRQKSLAKTQVIYSFWISLGILGLNLFLISPQLTQSFGSVAGNLAYLGVRFLVILGYSWYLAAVYVGRKSPIFRWATFLVFLDQVVLKLIYLKVTAIAHPEEWGGADLPALALGLFMSYMVSIPFLLLFAFLGAELGNVRFSRKVI
jgi:hypothetical protein